MSTLKAKHFHLIEDMDIAAMTFAAIGRIEAFADKVSSLVRLWSRRSHDRRALAQMNEHMLNDIGLCRADIDRETSKFFWQQ